MIRGGAVGDFILTLPAFHAVRNQFPKIRMEVLGYPHIASLVHRRFYVDEIRSIDRKEVAAFFVEKGKLDEDLCNYFRSFEVIVSYLYDPDCIFLENLKRAGAKKIILAESKPPLIQHAVDHWAHWLLELKIPFEDRVPKIYLTKDDELLAKNFLGNREKFIVGIHLGSGSLQKNWSVENFVELVKWVRKKNAEILIVEGPAEMGRTDEFWRSAISKECLRCFNQSLPLVAALLRQCKVFVGHDSGISHLSAAVGIPTITLFGPTQPKFWMPLGEKVQVIHRGVSLVLIGLEDIKRELEPFL